MLFSKSNFQYTDTNCLIHSFNKYLMNTYSVLGASVDTRVDKTDNVPVLKGAYILTGKEADNK